MKKLTIQFLCMAMVIMTLSVTETFAQRIKFKKAKISGKVTNVKHDTAKASGKVRFQVIGGQEGEPFFGYGEVDLIFGKNKKIIKKMVIKFKGKRNGKAVSGVLKTVKPIRFSSPITTDFDFSQVVVTGEGGTTI